MRVRQLSLFIAAAALAACGDTNTTRTIDTAPRNERATTTAGHTAFEPMEKKSLFGDSLFEDSGSARREPILTENMLPKHVLDRGVDAFSKSLESSNRRMVYSAAIAATELNPSRDFDNREMVMPALAEAIHLTGIRNIYVISHNANLRNAIKKFCRDNGYVFDGSSTAISALKDLRHSSARDLIVIDSGLNATDSSGMAPGQDNPEFPRVRTVETGDRALPLNALFAREVFLQIREDVRTSHIPVVVVAPAESSETEISSDTARDIYGDGISGVIGKPFDDAALKNVAEDLFHKQDKMAEDAKAEAEHIAIRACKAIAALRGKNTLFDVSVVNPSLIEAFQEPVEGQTARVPHLREAAIRAMQTVAAREAFRPLLAVAANTSNDDMVRSAAIDCLGTLYKTHADSITGADRTALIDNLSNRLREASPAIWKSAANTLGHLDLTSQERATLAVAHRINRSRKY